jgi:phenylpropionate dioxygenase-like ring-hydroxylating dioxygenase large terminal subunit
VTEFEREMLETVVCEAFYRLRRARNLSGAVGLLELHCTHRGTSLEFGLIDAEGIRCCHHGWLFAVDGAILETPGAPTESTLKDRLCHGAYPVHESHGIVFTYMGPPDRQPPFPVYDSFVRPGYRAIPGQKYFCRARTKAFRVWQQETCVQQAR